MSSETFISRWSRRKQAVRTAPSEEALEPGAEPERVEAHEPIASEQEPASGPVPEAELSADEIAALPSVEELTAETDISVFLRRGVPVPLRNAALRRMWSLDPKIRDFVGDAREYAYDWNIPGGVPGYGPLPMTDEIARMAAEIVRGETSGPEDKASKNCEQLSFIGPDAGTPSPAVPHDNAAQTRNEEAPCDTAHGADPSSSAEKIDESPQTDDSAVREQTDRADPLVGPTPRRHGGAIPL
jgi:hypothetical protein